VATDNEIFQRKRKAAITRMQARRDAAFVFDFDIIAGLKVQPLTLRLLILLDQVGSVFVTGKWRSVLEDNIGVELRKFLWLVSWEYSPNDERARRKFIKQVDKIDSAEVINEIREYIDAAFTDAPGGSVRDQTPHASMAAETVDLFAKEYGWHPETILELPMAQLWQYRNCISARTEKSPIMFNRELDQCQKEFMAERNRN
jgi:hypothetical protein